MQIHYIQHVNGLAVRVIQVPELLNLQKKRSRKGANSRQGSSVVLSERWEVNCYGDETHPGHLCWQRGLDYNLSACQSQGAASSLTLQRP